MTDSIEFRTIDGSGNNDLGGETGSTFRRLFDSAHEDGVTIPRGGPFEESTLPNPRTISNTIVRQGDFFRANSLNASAWLFQWGQFIDHDLDLNENNAENPGVFPDDFTPIPLPEEDDPDFDPTDPFVQDGITELPFIRIPSAEGTGPGTGEPRGQVNQLTSFIDGSNVYGSDEERAEFLRTFENGLLKTTIGDNGEILLPFNTEGLPTAGNGEPDFDPLTQYIGGDVRVNEQLGLTAVHTVMVREHNRRAVELKERLDSGLEPELQAKYEAFAEKFEEEYPDASEAEAFDEFVYEATRKVVSAQIQKITYDEFLPILIGDTINETFGDYDGFDPSVDPDVSVEFANAAYRLGHTLLVPELLRLDKDGTSETFLGDAFFDVENITENGVDSLIQGLIHQPAQEADNFIVDGVQSFLFPGGTGGLDLAAVNIARGREVGLPGYVAVYEALGLGTIDDFSDLPFTPDVIERFEAAYETVDQIDLWVGGISEIADDHGGLLGPTLTALVAEQFGASREGDRFFYLADSELADLEILAPDIDFTDTETSVLGQIFSDNVEHDLFIPEDPFISPIENTIFGDGAPNILLGSNLNDLIDGFGGDDEIQGRGGDDTLLGGTGNDDIRGNGGDDTISGGDGDDTLRGNGGDDGIAGGDGEDDIRGGSGNDLIKGERGDDDLRGNGGNDRFIWNNGDGSDRVRGGGGDDVQEVNGNTSLGDTFELGGDGSRAIFERLDGGAGLGNFVLTETNVETFEVNGLGGDDSLKVDASLSGTDVETVIFNGGDGADKFDSKNFAGTVEASGGGDDDDLRGGDGDDLLFGNSGDDELRGRDGEDILDGGTGDDRLFGGRDGDVLIGGDGTDLVSGGGGADTLIDGAGSDVLTGGNGPDTFALTGSVVGDGVTIDTIVDFDLGDILDVSEYTGISRLDSGLTFILYDLNGEDLLSVSGTEDGIASITV